LADLSRWLWLASSFLLAVVATQTTWWVWQKDQERFDSFRRARFSPLLLQIARFAYLIVFPFCALVWGRAVMGRLLGLQPLLPSTDPAAHWANWARDCGWGVGLGLAGWGLLTVGWLAARRVGCRVQLTGAPSAPWRLLGEAAYAETHWSFYRNAPIVALGPYWGTWLGLGLVAVEAELNPWWRADWRSADRAPELFARCGLAVLSAALYLQTTNLWLAVLVHWGVTWGLAACTRGSPRTLEGSADYSSPL